MTLCRVESEMVLAAAVGQKAQRVASFGVKKHFAQNGQGKSGLGKSQRAGTPPRVDLRDKPIIRILILCHPFRMKKSSWGVMNRRCRFAQPTG